MGDVIYGRPHSLDISIPYMLFTGDQRKESNLKSFDGERSYLFFFLEVVGMERQDKKSNLAFVRKQNLF